jgi:hypothetical protein
MPIFSHKHFSLIVIAVQCCLWFVVRSDPFFGDSIASTSKLANHIYDADLTTIFYPLDADPGHPTFYSYVLAIIWKIFGRTLWVSHVYSCLWAIILTFAFRKVAKQLLPPIQVNIATCLVLLFPTYLSQSAMMLNTVALMSFFLFALYGVFINNRWLILLFGILMCITHLQSVFLLLSLACFDVYRTVYLQQQFKLIPWFLNRFLAYTIPVAFFGAWLWLHLQHTGWLLVSPHYGDIEELNTMSEYIKAILLIGWRLVDYGMLPFYIILCVVFLQQKENRKEIAQWFILAAPCCLAMAIFLNNTIGHRYFMAFGMIAIITSLRYLQHLKPMGKIIMYLVLSISLLAGNFMYYPGKNIGDATLAYRSYFAIEKQLDNEFGNTPFYSHAPLANSRMNRFLETKGLIIERINETPFDSLPNILLSNVNAEFTQEQKEYLQKNWFGKSYENDAVYVTLFFNPSFNKQTDPSQFREPSWFEKWMIQLKSSAD